VARRTVRRTVSVDPVEDAVLRVWMVKLAASRSQIYREAIRAWVRSAETQAREGEASAAVG